MEGAGLAFVLCSVLGVWCCGQNQGLTWDVPATSLPLRCTLAVELCGGPSTGQAWG